MAYLLNKQTKWGKTQTVVQPAGGKTYQLEGKQKSALKPAYQGNSESKTIWSEAHKRPSSINHQRTHFDILNHTTNQNKFAKKGQDGKGRPDKTFSKVNGISEFAQCTRT